jgi:hypothetical protein
MRYLIILLLSILIISLNAQDKYQLSGGVESPLLYSGVTGLGISIPLNKKVTPLSLQQISELDQLQVNSLDRIAIKTYSLSAQQVSDCFLYSSSALPLSLLLDQGARKEFGTISTMYLETALINFGITELVKVLSKRTRPYAYNKSLNNELKIMRDTRKSFFSGHTSHVAASTFFTAKILSDMNPEGSHNSLYWITAGTISAVTGYLRIKGGKHFPTDVVAGYVIGALVGIMVPELHKTP